jgi:LEA14-like dessication related protein
LVFSGCSKPKAPTLTPEATRVASVTPQGIGIRVTLAALNPNDFDLNTQKVVGTIKLGDKVTLGPISKPHGIKLAANKSTNIDLDIEASWDQAAQLVQLAATGPKVPYEVEGTVTVGGESLNVDLPFKIKGEVSQTQLVAAGLRGLPPIPGLPTFK